MGRIAAILICLVASQAYADPQDRIPDLSMSPQETFDDFKNAPVQNNNNNNGGWNTNNSDFGNSFGNGAPPGNVSNTYPTVPSGSYMEGYCDPNFRPVVNNDCMYSQRGNICAEFQHLPPDAKAALDTVIACMENNGPGAMQDPACASADAQRMQLVKKYWNNQNTSHALMFLPDEMIQGSQKCLGRGR
jgi:hypothetical protein